LSSDSPIRVLLAEDHALFRRGLRTLLAEHGFEVVGEAGNGAAAVRLTEELKPDIVVMDLHMPQMTGVEATREIMARGSGVRVIVLTISVTDADVLEAVLAGASGYLLKDAEVGEIVAGIRAAAGGGSMISPSAATALVDRVREQGDPAIVVPEGVDLSEREREILRLIVDGSDNGQIAEQLHLSPSTVKNHISNILDKLGVEGRVQAAVYAVRSGLA
jgi:DNA-binding NarL/FixJ family response regulator